MFRIGGFLIVILIALVFLNPQIFQDLKNKSIEFINPAVKEKRLLNDLSYQIKGLSDFIDSEDFRLLTEDEKITEMTSFLKNSENLLSEVRQVNEKGDLIATVSSLLKKVLPGKSNQLDPQPTWLPPGAGCESVE